MDIPRFLDPSPNSRTDTATRRKGDTEMRGYLPACLTVLIVCIIRESPIDDRFSIIGVAVGIGIGIDLDFEFDSYMFSASLREKKGEYGERLLL